MEDCNSELQVASGAPLRLLPELTSLPIQKRIRRACLVVGVAFYSSMTALPAASAGSAEGTGSSETLSAINRDDLLRNYEESESVTLGAPLFGEAIELAEELRRQIRRGTTGAEEIEMSYRSIPMFWANNNFTQPPAFLNKYKRQLLGGIAVLVNLGHFRATNAERWCGNVISYARSNKIQLEFSLAEQCLRHKTGIYLAGSTPKLDSIVLNPVGVTDEGGERISITLQYKCSRCGSTIEGGNSKEGSSSFRVVGILEIYPNRSSAPLVAAVAPLVLNRGK